MFYAFGVYSIFIKVENAKKVTFNFEIIKNNIKYNLSSYFYNFSSLNFELAYFVNINELNNYLDINEVEKYEKIYPF